MLKELVFLLSLLFNITIDIGIVCCIDVCEIFQNHSVNINNLPLILYYKLHTNELLSYKRRKYIVMQTTFLY